MANKQIILLAIFVIIELVVGRYAVNGCFCTADYNPVCGKNRVTYSNGCAASCNGVQIAYRGPCSRNGGSQSRKKSCFCTADYSPECGENGVTYSNRCTASCNDVKIAHRGPCSQNSDSQPPIGDIPTACPAIYSPVCGSDGNTYENECQARASGVSTFSDGACFTIQ